MNPVKTKELQLHDLMPFINEHLAKGQSVKISPQGTSMLPMLRPGIDCVELSPLPTRLQKYDIPLYLRPNGQYVLHRIIKAADTYTCIGDNQFIKETSVCQDQMLAIVSAFYRGEKRYPVTHPGYQLYCRLWHHSRFIRRVFRKISRLVHRLF